MHARLAAGKDAEGVDQAEIGGRRDIPKNQRWVDAHNAVQDTPIIRTSYLHSLAGSDGERIPVDHDLRRQQRDVQNGASQLEACAPVNYDWRYRQCMRRKVGPRAHGQRNDGKQIFQAGVHVWIKQVEKHQPKQ